MTDHDDVLNCLGKILYPEEPSLLVKALHAVKSDVDQEESKSRLDMVILLRAEVEEQNAIIKRYEITNRNLLTVLKKLTKEAKDYVTPMSPMISAYLQTAIMLAEALVEELSSASRYRETGEG